MPTDDVTPRLPGIAPGDLTDEQRPVDARCREGIDRYLQGFVSQDAAGALNGPFPALVHFPELGGPAWDLFLALAGGATLPAAVREVVILSVGARSGAQYELYSHEVRARDAGLDEAKIRVITAGQRPADLSDEEALAYDVANVLLDGHQVPNSTYDAAVAAFGQRGAAELAYLAGCYMLIGALLNTFDVAAPAR